MSDLALIVRKLEAAEQIRSLKQAYARACDNGYSRTGLTEVFAEDAVWDGGSFGRYVGLEAICEFFAGQGPSVTYTKHFMLGHTVEVDDDLTRASGQCYMINPYQNAAGVTWYAGHYTETYRKANDRWLIADLKVELSEMPAIDPARVNSMDESQ